MMTPAKDSHVDLSAEAASSAIGRVASVFCDRCMAAKEALVADDWVKFDEFFQLQKVAWLNLNALIGKVESALPSEVSAPVVRSSLQPCKVAADDLQLEMARKLSRIEAEGRLGGRLKRHLSAFQANLVKQENFVKSA